MSPSNADEVVFCAGLNFTEFVVIRYFVNYCVRPICILYFTYCTEIKDNYNCTMYCGICRSAVKLY